MAVAVAASAPAAALTLVTSQLNRIALDLYGQAQAQESGSAATPLQDAVQRALYPTSWGPEWPLQTVLIGLGTNAAGRALSGWLEADYFVCRTLVPEKVACYELRFHPDEWSSETEGRRAQFDKLETLAHSLEAQPLISKGNELQSPILRVGAPPSAQSMGFFVLSGPEALQTSGQLLSLLGNRAELVLVTGHADAVLQPGHQEIIQTLVEAVGALQCVVLPQDEGTTLIPAWARSWQAPLGLPPFIYQRASASSLAGTDATRHAVREFARLRRLEEMTLLLREAIQEDVRATQTKKRFLETARPASASEESNPRAAAEKILSSFADEMEAIRRDRDEKAQRASLPGSPLYEAAERIVESTSYEDLRQEHVGQVIRLSLSAETNERLREAVRRELDRNASEDVSLLQDVLALGLEHVEKAAEMQLGFRKRLTPPSIDGARMREALSQLVQLNIRYRGEVPRATWKARFHAARSSMMGVSIFMMLVGGIGVFIGRENMQVVRSILLVIMLLAFVSGFILSIVGYKRVLAESIEREMGKLRDAVLAEFTRLLQSVMMEKRRILGDFLQRALRDIERQVSEQIQHSFEQRRRESDNQRLSAQEKARAHDTRIRALMTQQQSCDRLANELGQIRRQISQAMIDLQRAALTPTPTIASATPTK